jgi:two-component SAPR family response regulator
MHILHLEDDGPLRNLFRAALLFREPNATITQFDSSAEALDFIQKNLDDIDLFLLDVRVIGKLDGVAVAEKIREWGSSRPIVITSAYREPSSKVFERVKAEWLPKPWHIISIAQYIIPLAKNG